MNKDIVDYTKALSTFSNDKQALNNLFKRFVQKVTDQIVLMKDALRNNKEYKEIEITAHAIKGGALNLEASRLAQRAEALESASREKADSDELAQLILALKSELVVLENALNIRISD